MSELNYKNNEAPEKKFFSLMSEMRILNLSLEKINKQKEKFSAQVSQQRFFCYLAKIFAPSSLPGSILTGKRCVSKDC